VAKLKRKYFSVEDKMGFYADFGKLVFEDVKQHYTKTVGILIVKFSGARP